VPSPTPKPAASVKLVWSGSLMSKSAAAARYSANAPLSSRLGFLRVRLNQSLTDKKEEEGEVGTYIPCTTPATRSPMSSVSTWGPSATTVPENS
jgi:hypothetical protein